MTGGETKATSSGHSPPPGAMTSGMLFAAAGAPFAIVQSVSGSLVAAPLYMLAVAGAGSTFALLACATIMRWPSLGRLMATIAIFAALSLTLPRLLESPLVMLAVLVGATTALAMLWGVGVHLLFAPRRRRTDEGQARGAAITALSFWLVWIYAGRAPSRVEAFVVGWAMMVSTVLSLGAAINRRREHPRRALAQLVVSAVAIAILPVAVLQNDERWIMTILVGIAASPLISTQRGPQQELQNVSWWEPLLGHPERLFVGTFAALCVGGAVVLALPQSAASGRSIGVIDSLFTATSAVCVTGLIVLDTPIAFSKFGQAVILLLIQVGGLGIMTFSTVALLAMGKRLSLTHEGAVASLIGTQDRGQLFGTAKRILQLTVVCEALGASVLAAAFMAEGDTLLMAAWRGLFTAISAFCNAGFALQSESLIPYQRSPLILHTVGLLIILGGLSPLAVFALPRLLRRSAHPVSAQARLMVVATSLLLGLGFLFVLAFEWNVSLAGLSTMDRIHNAWFQSVTLRTAGFNSTDITAVLPATITLMLILMFIGGNPGGTAGGVKTTTVGVVVLSVLAAMRGQPHVEVFGRRISEATRVKASVVLTVAASSGVVALLAVQLTQNLSSRIALFEVVSALGTVGLSIGGTSQLDGVGKTIILMCMFVGRVGGLTLLMFLRSRRVEPSIARPEEQIDVG